VRPIQRRYDGLDCLVDGPHPGQLLAQGRIGIVRVITVAAATAAMDRRLRLLLLLMILMLGRPTARSRRGHR
jgi:hypothetical protein